MDYTISLTEGEAKALEWEAYSNQDWIQNAASNRARIAIEEIVRLYTSYKLDNGEAITATSKEEMVLAAYAEGIITSAAERTDAAIAASNAKEAGGA